ncbi:MAG: aldo/keto reductase [Nocardioidaceae bacterium]|nr:aldo/keto reductase [Nocardioidaceae bacterium]
MGGGKPPGRPHHSGPGLGRSRVRGRVRVRIDRSCLAGCRSRTRTWWRGSRGGPWSAEGQWTANRADGGTYVASVPWSRGSYLDAHQSPGHGLRRLGTDWIDVYQMHHVDRRVPWEEIWQAMERLIADGKILYVGSSNFAGWHIAQANETAQQRHRLGLISEQSLYNLCERSIELEVLPACRAYGVGVVPWSPLHGGALGGILAKADRNRSAGGRAEGYLEENREQVEAFEDLCRDLDEEPANVALAWLLHQDGVTAPIIGPRTTGQLDGAVRAVELQLDEATLRRLDELFPGPGPAPEAYAW